MLLDGLYKPKGVDLTLAQYVFSYVFSDVPPTYRSTKDHTLHTDLRQVVVTNLPPSHRSLLPRPLPHRI
jgi:hypothetical protein